MRFSTVTRPAPSSCSTPPCSAWRCSPCSCRCSARSSASSRGVEQILQLAAEAHVKGDLRRVQQLSKYGERASLPVCGQDLEEIRHAGESRRAPGREQIDHGPFQCRAILRLSVHAATPVGREAVSSGPRRQFAPESRVLYRGLSRGIVERPHGCRLSTINKVSA